MSPASPHANPTNVKNIISSDPDANLQELSESHADTESIKKRSVAGVISYMFRTAAVYGITVGANFFLAAFLTPAEFGVYYIVTAVLGLFMFLSDIGLASALIQKKDEPTIDDLRTTFTVQQLLAVVICLSIIALTPYWRHVHDLAGVELWLLYVVAASPILISFKTPPSILLLRQLRFDLLSLPTIAENVVFYVLVTLLAWQGFGIQSFLWGVLARDIVGIAIMYGLQRWPIGFALSRSSLKELLKYGMKFQLNDLLARIKDDLFTVVIVSAWLDKNSLGYIAWAKKYTQMPQQFTVNNVTAITFPTFSRLQHDPKLLQKAIEKTTYFITLLSFPLLAGMTIFFLPLVQLIPKYNQWIPITPTVLLFAINIAWSTLSTPLTNTLNAIGQVNKTLGLMVMWTVLTWTITPLCIRYFGFNGVALASALIGTSSIVTIVLVQKVVPFRLWANIWRQLFATAMMSAFAWSTLSLWSQSLLGLATGVLLSGGVFTLVFLLVGWYSVQEELRSLGLWPNKLLRSRS